jgi:predicted amidohydrolase
MNPIKAAVVQAAPILFDTPKTIEKLSALARDAAGRGANLVVFPEAFVSGYPKGLDFCPRQIRSRRRRALCKTRRVPPFGRHTAEIGGDIRDGISRRGVGQSEDHRRRRRRIVIFPDCGINRCKAVLLPD